MPETIDLTELTGKEIHSQQTDKVGYYLTLDNGKDW